MTGHVFGPTVHEWVCLSCDFEDVTQGYGPAGQRMHTCAGLKGLSVPMVPKGTRGSNSAVEREDYIGREIVQFDDAGRPVMSVITTRDDGQDCTVYAPTALVRTKE